MKNGIKNNFFKSDCLKNGLFGLKISLMVLILLLFFLFYKLASYTDFNLIYTVLFQMPNSSGLLFIYAGAILFIIVPFLTGILVGDKLSSLKHK